MNKKIIGFIILSLVLLGCFIFNIKLNLGKFGQKMNVDFSDQNTLLTKMKTEAWQQLNTLGITQKECDTLKQNNYDAYLRASKRQVGNTEITSPEIQKMVVSILQEFGIDPTTITIVSWNGYSPASAGDYFININKELLLDLTVPSQRFVIAHEVQHIINKDHSTDFFVYQFLPKEDWSKQHPASHPLMHYYRFREQRADMQAAMRSKEWAECYEAYSQEIMQKLGNTNDPTHPQNSDRLKMAQNIVQTINNQLA